MKTSKLNLLAALAWFILFVATIFIYGDTVPKFLYLIVVGLVVCLHFLDYFNFKRQGK